jgi:hypothetical protein
LADIANKYHFVSTETLAIRLLRSCVIKDRAFLKTISSSFLERAIKTVMLLNDRDLEKDFVQIYAERILAGNGRPLAALKFANQYSL